MKVYYEKRNYNNLGFYCRSTTNLNFAAHWHSDIEILLVQKGCIGVGINSEYRTLKKNDILICSNKDIHYYNSINEESQGIILIFKPEFLDTIKHLTHNSNPVSTIISLDTFCTYNDDPDFTNIIYDIFNDILKEIKNADEMHLQLVQLKIAEMFLLLYRYDPNYFDKSIKNRESFNNNDMIPMRKALKYIEENYSQDVSLEMLSNHVGLSLYYLSRLFKNTTGTNFKSFLTNLRINKAEELIKTTDMRIIDIAYLSGFSSIRTFNRTFVKVNGYTPKSLRTKELQ